jgi:pSer/pThr/pTyr-binding forkhead associated (FHA) protein
MENCLLCHNPLAVEENEFSERATLREVHGHLVMFLEVVSGPVEGDKFFLTNGLKLGRSNQCEVQIKSEETSRVHAEIILSLKEGWLLSDLDSTNGTYFNDIRIDAPARLKPGDRIEIGEAIFSVKGGK